MSFLFPGIAVQYKEAIMPYHIFFGVFNFILAIATSVLGFGEKLIFVLYVFKWNYVNDILLTINLLLNREQEYKNYPKEGMFVNFLGLLFIFYGGLVVFMVTKPEFKREPKPEDGVLLTGALE